MNGEVKVTNDKQNVTRYFRKIEFIENDRVVVHVQSVVR
ncbi:hypothetical protein SAMN04488542_1368 [Fontibacillus panacisegetis]|uniref:Uncharacterized protein n=1 Tax=Fontibacillus panacisegetis TaxID=670482 RepID=A0A1G7TC62_9BACL|nr:hypothetical protein SAMN04488542_1368 [Fontibacillus panacisegetis]